MYWNFALSLSHLVLRCVHGTVRNLYEPFAHGSRSALAALRLQSSRRSKRKCRAPHKNRIIAQKQSKVKQSKKKYRWPVLAHFSLYSFKFKLRAYERVVYAETIRTIAALAINYEQE